MNQIVTLLASGITTGAIYGSLALALVMTYRSTGLINFAQGEMAMFSTYVAWYLTQVGAPYFAAFAAALVTSFFIGVVIQRCLIKPVPRGEPLSIIIIFVGLLLIFNSGAGFLFSYSEQVFPSPFTGALVSVPGYFSAHDVGAIAVMFAVLLILFLFFRFTTTGLKMRGAAENPLSSKLLGISVDRMLALGWGLAAMVGAVSGIMAAPILYLDPNMMGGVLLYSFAAALVGGIGNPLGAVIGGFVVAITENLMSFIVGPDIKLTLALAIVIAVLVWRPNGIFGTASARRV
jgi:branched-chain amino acid transport system permease protein